MVGAFVPSQKTALQRFVIACNNRLIRLEHFEAKRILILLPHCLQTTLCDVRVTHKVENCKLCGRCSIAGLLSLARQTGIKIFIATGGTLARRIVKEYIPEAIVAVACERDLSSGVVDTFPLPVLGVINERPSGPCVNTTVDITKVKEAVCFFSGCKP